MPNNFNFSNIKDVKTIEVSPTGWITPLYVEYGIFEDIAFYGGSPCYFWRVKNTEHTFVISTTRMDFLSSGDIKNHFRDVLEKFKEDYLTWKEEGFITQWSREYEHQYSRFIII